MCVSLCQRQEGTPCRHLFKIWFTTNTDTREPSCSEAEWHWLHPPHRTQSLLNIQNASSSSSYKVTNILLCMCVHVCRGVCKCTHSCECMWTPEEWWGSSSMVPHVTFWSQVSHWAQSAPFHLASLPYVEARLTTWHFTDLSKDRSASQ